LLDRAHGVLCRSPLLAALLTALLALTTFSTAGCGDDASSTSTPDASERDGDPGTGDDAMRPIDAREPPDADPNAPDSGARSCGGFAGEVCDPADFCDFPDNDCGAADSVGTCKTRPDLCQPVIDEVCGCDGSTYQTECNAQMAGTDIASEDPC
jgi:hypothetical protein